MINKLPTFATVRVVAQTRPLLILISLTLAHNVLAQTLPVASTMPTVTELTSSALEYSATLSRYKPMTDQKLGSWRDANDTVGRIGGWRTYLKQAQTPDDAPPLPKAPGPASAPQPTSAVDPHSGHGAKR